MKSRWRIRCKAIEPEERERVSDHKDNFSFKKKKLKENR